MKTSAEILRVLDEILTVLNANDYPTPNKAAVERLKLAASQMGALDNYAAEKTTELLTLAQDFYSVRGHAKYSEGISGLWARMTIDLPGRIRGRAKNIEERGG